MDIKMLVQSTPNPNARKFIINRPVLTDGKMTFSSRDEAEKITLARDIFEIAGIEQVHFFDNFITVTKSDFANDWEQVEPQVKAIIQTRMPIHDPNIKPEALSKKTVNRESLPPEIQKIEEILDRTIRPGLQGDGGDLEVLSYENKLLSIRYQGACGTCPSSTAGTLQAIENILQNEFDPELRITSM